MRRHVIGMLVLTGAIALLGSGTANASDPGGDEARTAEQRPLLAPGSRYLLARIDRYRRETWRWQRLMGKPLMPSSSSARASRNPEYRRWVLRLWKHRAAKMRRLAHSPPRRAAWLCIYRHERHPHQGWATRTGNGFFGGLQMNITFQRQYGAWLLHRKGTADRWTPLEQIWTAERAHRSGQGFYPWPNTARYCGLI